MFTLVRCLQITVPLQVTAIMIGVEDLDRSKKFYGA
jgi:hypothetical protein